MPSRFPGIDPFIEAQEWEDFHARFNTAVSDALSVQAPPRYLVRIERRVYLELPFESDDFQGRPDVAVLYSGPSPLTATAPKGAIEMAVPFPGLVPMPEERRESYLVIRDRETLEVVTVIETLSPSNKRTDSGGTREYLRKRGVTLESHSHLVELDLLRGGKRLPMSSAYPPGDFFAIVSRSERRPQAEIYAWTLRQPLPTIPVPLLLGDSDIPLDLQAVVGAVYERAHYDRSVDYQRVLAPLLSDAESVWLKSCLE